VSGKLGSLPQACRFTSRGSDSTSDELGVKKVLQWVTKQASRQAIVFEILTISGELIPAFFVLLEI